MANYKNDDFMVYNLEKHRYELTPYAVETDLGINLSDLFAESDDPDRESEIFLKRCSRELYSYIYKYNIKTKDIKEYVLSLPENREGILETLEEFVYSLIKNATDPSLYYKTNDIQYLVSPNRGKRASTKPVTDSVQFLLDQYGLSWSGNYTYGSYPTNYKSLRGVDY